MDENTATPSIAFTVDLVPVGRPARDEATRRLRAALKALLRSYRLRCVRIEERH